MNQPKSGMTNRKWSKRPPSIGEVLIHLLSLSARMNRLEAMRRMAVIAKTIRLLKE